MCAYYRHYYPIEFITAFLNDAANEDDIENGTKYAEKVGIKITMPKWGISKSEYAYDKESNTIAKGLSSIKYMGSAVAKELYDKSLKKANELYNDALKSAGDVYNDALKSANDLYDSVMDYDLDDDDSDDDE